MNAADVLHYGHQEIMRAVEGVANAHWETSGVCGYWTVKDVLAHLDSYERMLIEMVDILQGQGPGPVLQQRMADGEQFNDNQVADYQQKSPEQVLAEYQANCQQARARVAEIPAEMLRQPGTLPHYGEEYAFDDMLVYQYYGHKREHSAQINAFVDRIHR